MTLGLAPEIAHHASRYVLIDVRPPTERYCGIGFIPGSLVMPPWQDLREGADRLEHLAGGKRPVLVCLTGEQARARALSLGHERSPHHLAGGLQRWAAAGWPVAGTWVEGAPAPSHEPGRFPRALRAELDELLDEESGRGLLGRCERATGVSVDGCPAHRLHAWLDRVAVGLLELGLPRTRVGHLVDRLLTRLPPPIPGLTRLASARAPNARSARYRPRFVLP